MAENTTPETPAGEIRFERIVDKLVSSDLGGTAGRLSSEEKDFLRRHPQLLDRINDSGFIKKRYIVYLASFSLMCMALAKTLEYTKILDNWPILADFLTNVTFSIATEMFGASLMT